jgi:hypothetical protein
VGAVCGKAARTDLCGGREVTRVPTAKAVFAAMRESGIGRYSCKGPKWPGANFPAVRQSDRRFDMASITLPRSPVSLSSGDEVPHIFTRKSRLRPKEFLISSAKRLLQQNRHTAAMSQRSAMSAAGGSRRADRVRGQNAVTNRRSKRRASAAFLRSAIASAEYPPIGSTSDTMYDITTPK